MNNTARKYFSVFDIFIIFIAVIASAIALLSQFNNDKASLVCIVRVEGDVVYTVEMTSVTEPVNLQIDSEYPLIVNITQESVCIKNASCPDKLCEHSASITRSGQSIVCLPAKVSVTLENIESENEFDAVVG